MFQVVKGSEILEVLYSLPDTREFLFSLYNCHYSDFFKQLGTFETLTYFSAHWMLRTSQAALL